MEDPGEGRSLGETWKEVCSVRGYPAQGRGWMETPRKEWSWPAAAPAEKFNDLEARKARRNNDSICVYYSFSQILGQAQGKRERKCKGVLHTATKIVVVGLVREDRLVGCSPDGAQGLSRLRADLVRGWQAQGFGRGLSRRWTWWWADPGEWGRGNKVLLSSGRWVGKVQAVIPPHYQQWVKEVTQPFGKEKRKRKERKEIIAFD